MSYVKRPERLERIMADSEFPHYTFIPGLTVHPEKEPGGHSYAKVCSDSMLYSESNWQSSESYRYGFDLFNFGYYWEAHESWEEIWQQLKNNHKINQYFKGLIKVAAAGVKALQKNTTGFVHHMSTATMHFTELVQLPENVPSVSLYYSELLTFTQDQIDCKDSIIRKEFESPDNIFNAAIYPERI